MGVPRMAAIALRARFSCTRRESILFNRDEIVQLQEAPIALTYAKPGTLATTLIIISSALILQCTSSAIIFCLEHSREVFARYNYLVIRLIDPSFNLRPLRLILSSV